MDLICVVSQKLLPVKHEWDRVWRTAGSHALLLVLRHSGNRFD